MATLGRGNYRSAAGLCELAAGLGARGVILERFVPLGRGLEMSDAVLTSREWRELLRAICRIADMEIDASDGENDDDAAIAPLLPYRAFWIDMPLGLPGGACSVSGALCQLGPSFMALMPNGTVYPCRRAPIPAGKLPDNGMARVLESLGRYSSVSQRCFGFDF
jgi:MoaA/NifB/PqqE/SkfB family radical SAM enzyme